MKSKFKFFAATAKILNSFLVKFTNNNPMVPFLAQAKEEIMCLSGLSFLLKETLSKGNTYLHLSKLNFYNPSLHKHPGDVDPGIGVKLELSILRKNGKINEYQVLNFKRDVVSFLSKIYTHLAEKSPIKLSLPRNSRCFIPSLLVENPESSKQDFFMCWKTLLLLNKSQMDLQNKLNISFQSFWKLPKKASRVLLNLIPQKKVTALILSTEVAKVLKIILTLSHRQASVE